MERPEEAKFDELYEEDMEYLEDTEGFILLGSVRNDGCDDTCPNSSWNCARSSCKQSGGRHIS
ncbi:hypothetical protein T265_02361 [Opisthorchis viverrini]|uniref:Uncharacterized protein n=1 Tax=Opisthorchis viverrini TaxID=6198 RepID=A0A075AID7_OPIVI|nr:hypothetical protein T265_02361 [Opisthorchis viverrini]KER31454.1 hypothetical protein T265_02361 [Opisthorchis viverrini]